MILNEYIEKGGQKLRLGYTTGSCAAAAAKAAAFMLLTGEKIPGVRVRTPKGIDLLLEVEDIRWEGVSPESPDVQAGIGTFPEIPCIYAYVSTDSPESAVFADKTAAETLLKAVSCAIRKDSGDDPDVTNGALIYARVSPSATPGIRIDGGEGVGRVTRPGLDQPVGAAAINSTPRAMIARAVREAVDELAEKARGQVLRRELAEKARGQVLRKEPAGKIPPGFDVTISVPAGRELAAKTFNPKLGIVGGISILGTTGIVEPMSEQALLDTIRTEISVRAREGWPILPAAPGNYGKQFFLDAYGFSLDTAVTSSNFICDTVKMAEDAGFTRMLFVGHIGKLVKVAGGIRNTHSQYGDRRMEILADIAEAVMKGAAPAGDIVEKGNTGEPPGTPADESAPETEIPIRSVLADCVSTDEAVRILRARGLAEPVLAEMTRRIQAVMQEWAGGRMQVEVIVFSNVHGELGRTQDAAAFMEELKSEKNAR